MNFKTKPTKSYPWDVVVDACYFGFHGPRADNKVWQATITGTVKDTLSSCISKTFKSFHINEI
jgi:hypothetical protein